MRLGFKIVHVPDQNNLYHQSKYSKELGALLGADFAHVSMADSAGILIGSGYQLKHGIDLEFLKKRAPAFEDFVLTSTEKQLLLQHIKNPYLASWAWSIKEACFKCASSGYEPSDFVLTGYVNDHFVVTGINESFNVWTIPAHPSFACTFALVQRGESDIIDFNEQRTIISNALGLI